MKTIGLLGGMSWVCTELYYRAINRTIAEQLGGSHSAKIVLFSFDFSEIELFQERGAWDIAATILGDGARKIVSAGADFIAIASNTMHLVADEVERIAGAPLLHIGDATASVLGVAGIKKAALLGTRYTMEKPFLRDKLAEGGIDVMIPNDEERATIHAIIYGELIKDFVRAESRDTCVRIVERLRQDGAQGIILGCTELELLLTPEVTTVPLFRTAEIHAKAIAAHALET